MANLFINLIYTTSHPSLDTDFLYYTSTRRIPPQPPKATAPRRRRQRQSPYYLAHRNHPPAAIVASAGVRLWPARASTGPSRPHSADSGRADFFRPHHAPPLHP
eukprot:7089591-Pyramimonas_sp.AAC.1